MWILCQWKHCVWHRWLFFPILHLSIFYWNNSTCQKYYSRRLKILWAEIPTGSCSITLGSLLSESDVDKLYFFNKFNKLINKHAPHYLNAKLSHCQNYGLPLKWTGGSIRIRNELFFSGDREKYNDFRNKMLHPSKISKRTLGRCECIDQSVTKP